MRVLESSIPSQYSMGKKKHKLRKASHENEFNTSEDDEAAAVAAAKNCRHINKSVNLAAVRKGLRQGGPIGDCLACSKDGANSKNQTGGSNASSGAAAVPDPDPDDMLDELETTIWVCLQCGNQGCDRNSKHQHALKHYQAPRSVSHSMVVNLTTWLVWCYECDDEVDLAISKKLEECVEFVRKQAGMPKPEQPASAAVKKVAAEEEAVSQDNKNQQSNKVKGAASTTQAPSSLLPGKVKGLSNLGNTCFFNAVMQNLSQTYALEEILNENSKKGLSVHIASNADADVSSSDQSSEEDSDTEEKLQPRIRVEPLSVELPEAGSLTLSMLSFLKDMNSATKNNVISPSYLFGQVCKKAPRFKGFQQQDSHELLRHLLDGMKTEEIKRVQSAILQKMNINPKKCDEDTKAKLKVYGQYTKQTFVDSVFGGLLLSTVTCEECNMSSQIFEPFLDLSLPIAEEKPSRPNSLSSCFGSKKKPDQGLHVSKKEEDSQEQPLNAVDGFARNTSKHMSKKQRKQQKKMSKLKKNKVQPQCVLQEDAAGGGDGGGGGGEHDVVNGAMEIEENESKDGEVEDKEELTVENGKELQEESQSTEENSDADIEDNLETASDTSRNKFKLLEMPETVPVGDRVEEEEEVQHTNTENTQHLSDEQADLGGHSKEKMLIVGGASDGLCASTASTAEDVDPSLNSEERTKENVVHIKQNGTNTCQQVEESASIKENVTDLDNITASLAQVQLEEAPVSQVKSDDNALKTDSKPDEKDQEKVAEDMSTCPEQTSENGQNSSVKSVKSLSDNSLVNGQVLPLETNKFSSDSQNSSPRHNNSSAQTLQSKSKVPKSRDQMKRECVKRSTYSLSPRYKPTPYECSVLSCLNQFTTMELLTGNNKFGCEFCSKRNRKAGGKKGTTYTSASKQLQIYSPPAVLTLQLKRFQQVGYTLRKVSRHVDFPLILDLAPFCSSMCQRVQPGKKKILYALYGVVEHSGRLTGGHYTAFVKVRPNANGRLKEFLQTNGITAKLPIRDLSEDEDEEAKMEEGEPKPPPGRWFYVSDSRVSEAAESNVLRAQAYLLFYERIF
ncbi:ubiquitin carboxyl-terminal hydrolase 16-like isoform X2 [Lingula anatina]|uniref:ubiquitinyl hydrolase 1 n=1 Tax=Lingula anatina TaxID=7574 RepID=A0A1S3HB85_LINAN|nr:ubiquitin carboxyl-terminal hydrolase 16-like isoform X2 [Lingula anatina]|eukprot:XP_013383302.1 ubiquitin carboxyl-terminal hydrolase 16-like isoform X2 [Lingula anatina]